jgi:hypothetical protein
MADGPVAVVCAWCNRIVNPPARRTPVTHTICPTCLARALEQQGGGATSNTDSLNLPPAYFGNVFRH